MFLSEFLQLHVGMKNKQEDGFSRTISGRLISPTGINLLFFASSSSAPILLCVCCFRGNRTEKRWNSAEQKKIFKHVKSDKPQVQHFISGSKPANWCRAAAVGFYHQQYKQINEEVSMFVWEQLVVLEFPLSPAGRKKIHGEEKFNQELNHGKHKPQVCRTGFNQLSFFSLVFEFNSNKEKLWLNSQIYMNSCIFTTRSFMTSWGWPGFSSFLH